ncbi:GumC family protein [Roseovarius sp. S4756]|uniref:GumC family protein n=1 Tax=Roseovarius maritimus TaxID=3342637 RepID=UPI00372C3FE6
MRQMEVDGNEDEVDLMELLRALWIGKWTILLSMLIATLMGAFYVFGWAEPKYTSTAQMTLEMRSKQVVDIESVISGVSTEQAALNTELEIILSRRVLGDLVDELDLVNDPEFNSQLNPPSLIGQVKGFAAKLIAPADSEQEEATPKSPRDQVINRVRGVLSASVKRDTYVFSISATTKDPDQSKKIVNALADIYINEQIAVKFEATEKAVAWLSTRVTELEQDLREKEEELKRLRAETELTNPEALDGLNLQAKDLRDRLQEMRNEAEKIEINQTRMRELLDAGELLEVAQMTQDPTLLRAARLMRDGDTEASEVFDQRFDLLMQSSTNERERMASQIAALSESYQKLQSRIDRQSTDLVRIQEAQREVETTRTLYETFLTRLKETSVQRGLQQADSRVLSDAISGEQVAPRTSRMLALFMILGGLVGAAIILLKNILNNVFRTPEDLEASTGISVLGQIPKMPIKSRDRLIPYLKEKPTSAAAEAVRNLRTSILLSNIDSPPKVIMLTSSLPNEGKTTQAIALTQNLAGLGKKVLLMEADIRRRTFSNYFQSQPAGGLISALSGEAALNEIVFYDEELKADVLMGEATSINAADVFSSDRFSELLGKAREVYDFVIIDTPPVLVVPDARVVGQHVDAILLAVAWDSTHRSQVMAALREIDSVNLRVAGLILSQIDPKGMRRYGYGGKHGSYSAYGKGYYDAE